MRRPGPSSLLIITHNFLGVVWRGGAAGWNINAFASSAAFVLPMMPGQVCTDLVCLEPDRCAVLCSRWQMFVVDASPSDPLIDHMQNASLPSRR